MSKPTFAEAERLFLAGDPSARDALEPLALAQHPGAARRLGELYSANAEGEPSVEACLWFALAAELGDAEAAAGYAACVGPLGAEQRARFHIEHTVLRGRVFGDPEALLAPVEDEQPQEASGPAPNSTGVRQSSGTGFGRSMLDGAQGALQRFQQRLRERAAAAQQQAQPEPPQASAGEALPGFAAFTPQTEGMAAAQPGAEPAPLAGDPFAAFKANFKAQAEQAGGLGPAQPYGEQAPPPPPPPPPAGGEAPQPDPAMRGEDPNADFSAELHASETPVTKPGFLRPFGTPAPEPEAPAAQAEADDDDEDWMSPTFTDPWLEPGVPAAPRTPSGRLRLKRVTVVDPSGFSEPVDAFSIMIPSGWKGQGSVRWVPSYDNPANTVQVSFHASTPDGRTGVTVFPTHSWTHSNMGFGPVGPPPLGAAGYVERMLLPRSRNHVQNLRVLERTPRPDVARSLWEGAVGQLQGMPGMELKVDSARVRIAYSYKGVDYEEWILATTECVICSMSMPGMGFFGFGAPQASKTYSITAQRLTGFHAPQGELEQYEGLLGTIVASAEANPRWTAAVQEWLRGMNKISAKGASDRAAIRRKSMDEISAMRKDTWEKQQASRDRMHKKVIQNIRGVESWVDPNTGKTIELSQGLKGAWRNGLGDVVVTDNVVDADREFLNWNKLRRPPDDA